MKLRHSGMISWIGLHPFPEPTRKSYSYNQIGNITQMNGTSYTYGTKPHAVTGVGTDSYTYDANGNMISKVSSR